MKKHSIERTWTDATGDVFSVAVETYTVCFEPLDYPMANMTPNQAREVAAFLVKCADVIEKGD